MPYSSVVSWPFARRARVMTSRMTGPRRLPTWTVPDGVFESLTTCGPWPRAARSPAQSMCLSVARRPPPGATAAADVGDASGDLDDLVGEVPGRDLHDD